METESELIPETTHTSTEHNSHEFQSIPKIHVMQLSFQLIKYNAPANFGIVPIIKCI